MEKDALVTSEAAEASTSGLAVPQRVSLQTFNEKRPSKKEATVSKKRQKVIDSRQKDVQTALNILSLDWKTRIKAATALRQEAATAPRTLCEELVRIWDGIRAADARPRLTEKQVSLIPRNAHMLSFFARLFSSPLTWGPADFPSVIQEQADRDLEDTESNKVQYYLRRLRFDSLEELAVLLEQVRRTTPQYAGQIDNLLLAGKGIAPRGFFISYGGFTIASSPVGRDLDDTQASESDAGAHSFLKAVLRFYEGKVAVYEVLPLAFEIGTGAGNSVKLSRGDPRTSLYESLVIDSLGFVSLNTAAAGTVIELEKPAEFIEMKEALKKHYCLASPQPAPWQIPASSASSG